MRSLLACSLICYLWYIAAAPHLHHTLTIDDWTVPPNDKRYNGPSHSWPQPVQQYTMRYFSVLTNLQELGIDIFQTSGFISNPRRHFGHPSSTLRFLALKDPRGSCRQILYFVGLFPNLQDLELNYPFFNLYFLSLSYPGGGTGRRRRCVTPSPLRTSAARTADARVFLKGEACEGHDRSLRRTPFSFHGPLHGDVCAATLRRMCLEALRLYQSDPHSE